MASVVDQRGELLRHYCQAKNWIDGSPFVREVEWQRTRDVDKITESQFLCEYAWVVLNSGFRESVVRQCFDYISLCFCDWESAAAIARLGETCIECALPAFGNRKKLSALLANARVVELEGFESLRSRLNADAMSVLETMPFIGSVTKWHLAKNLGLDVAKPDRHLVRVATRYGYDDVQRMCRDIFEYSGDRIGVADLVLWRFEERSFA